MSVHRTVFHNRILINDSALGILSSKQSTEGFGTALDDKEQNRLQEGYKKSFGMQEGKHNIHMTEATVEWHPMSYPVKDLLLMEGIDSNMRTIIDAIGLNDNIFSREKASTFSNLKEV
jgi:hypothetical protein